MKTEKLSAEPSLRAHVQRQGCVYLACLLGVMPSVYSTSSVNQCFLLRIPSMRLLCLSLIVKSAVCCARQSTIEVALRA